MRTAVFILFDPDKLVEEFSRVKNTHPKLNDTTTSEIVLSESIGCIFSKEHYANTEMDKQRQAGKNCVIVKRYVDDPDELLPPKKMSDLID